MKLYKKIHMTFSILSSTSKSKPGKTPKKSKCFINIAAFLALAVIWAIPGCSYSSGSQSAPYINPTMADSLTPTTAIALRSEPAPTIAISNPDATDFPDQPTPAEAIVPTEELDPVATSTPVPEPSLTPLPTDTPTPELTPTPIPLPTNTPTPELTHTPTPLPTNTPTPEPTPTPTPLPTYTPTPEPTPTPTPLPTNTPTPEPTPTPTLNNNQSNEQTTMVWIPRTGKKYHRSASCSGMKNPSQVSVDEAIRRGFTPCKKCY